MTKLKPTHRLKKSKTPCTKIRITYLIKKEHILEIIAGIVEMWYDYSVTTGLHRCQKREANHPITRKIVEERLRHEFNEKGSSWYDNPDECDELVHKNADYKEETLKWANKLFPDWFAGSAQNYILDLDKEK